MAGAGRQREQHGDPGQGEADPRLLDHQLRVDRPVLRRVRHPNVRPVGDKHVPPVPLPPAGEAGLEPLGRLLGQVAQHSGGNASAGVAVAGGVWRTHLEAACGAMGDDPGYGVTATLVLIEDLAEKAPDGSDGTEHSVAIIEAMLIESVEDAQFAQGVGERQSLVARKASADLLQGSHRRITNSLVEVARNREAPKPSPALRRATRTEIASPLHYTWQSPARCASTSSGCKPPRVPLS